eukprot:scaffold218846_cov31-Prasinocladus_malaysianus.AAC.1
MSERLSRKDFTALDVEADSSLPSNGTTTPEKRQLIKCVTLYQYVRLSACRSSHPPHVDVCLRLMPGRPDVQARI